jgi:death-on-curing family protein
MENRIEFFTLPDGNTQIDVHFEGESFWLSQDQIAELFERNRTVISKHLKNIFKEGELDTKLVCANFAHTTKHGAIPEKKQTKKVQYYNLDAILSVGYRINSKRGTQFRQWATEKLKEYLTEGYAINKKRLEQKHKEIQILHDGIRILSRSIDEQLIYSKNFDWIHRFNMGLKLLDDYDHEKLDSYGTRHKKTTYPDVAEYLSLIDKMKVDFQSNLFGRKKDYGFESAIYQISQSVNHDEAYPSIEEKAAMLLYLLIKNHAFVDGNKRIAAACFLLFLEKNDLLYNNENQFIISNEALASLTLFVASSKTEEMNTVKRLLISVLNRSLSEN